MADTEHRHGKFLFDEAIALLADFDNPHILEIGGMRSTQPGRRESDGHSTLRWADTGYQVTTIENNPRHCRITRLATAQFKNVNVVLDDGVAYLRRGNYDPISLLYLDGPAPDAGGKEVAELALQFAKLADKSLVLIDDCDSWPERWTGRGKGDLAIPLAESMGYRVVSDCVRQVLMSRGNQ